MKDLCEVHKPELNGQHRADEVNMNTGSGIVPEPPRIKSFHRRNIAGAANASNRSAGGNAPVEQPKPLLDDDFADQQDLAPQADVQKIDVVVDSDPQLPGRPLPLWGRLRMVTPDADIVDRKRLPLVDRFRDTDSARSIDLLRTRLLHTLRSRGWRRVAIASPTSGCGATWTTVNLAQSLSRVPNSRTVVMDMNFRTPGVASAMGLPAAGNMNRFLLGELSAQRHLLRMTDSLAVGLNSRGLKDAAEILHSPTSAQVIDDMIDDCKADVALFDLPPVLEHDDLTAFLPQVDGVLLVADGTRTTSKDLAACEKVLAGHTQILGVVLNRARSA